MLTESQHILQMCGMPTKCNDASTDVVQHATITETSVQGTEGLSGKGKAAAGKLSIWLALCCGQLCRRRVVSWQALERPACSQAAEGPDVVGVLCQVLHAGLQPEQGSCFREICILTACSVHWMLLSHAAHLSAITVNVAEAQQPYIAK